MTATVLHGDCLDVLPTMAGSADAVVCDPPYGLAFMGKAWDHGVPGVPFWEAVSRVAKPGAYLLACGGTRTYHRLTCAIEDAGFEVHDCLSWLYGSGFPKHKSKLKPAWEPIVLARKPAPRATPLNIDACRLGGDWSRPNRRTALGIMNDDGWAPTPMDGESHPAGRWPANVVLDEDAAEALDAQSGERGTHDGGRAREWSVNKGGGCGIYSDRGRGAVCSHGDTGGASRFFYTAKASRAEREAGMHAFAERPLLWSAGTQSPGTFQSEGTRKAARNHHPTVKPLALMRWLVRLVTPPGGLVLDPFAGSGSTGCAAVLEGRRFVGIEREAEYVAIARARIAHHAREYAPDLFSEASA